MKQTRILTGIIAMLGLMVTAVGAQTTENFFITAEIPPATSVSFNVSQVDPGPPITFEPIDTTSLSFNMQFFSDLGIYLPEKFFAIDVGPVGGAGNPDMTIEYADTNNPNSVNGTAGLTAKGTATVVRVEGAEGSQTENTIISATLGDIDNTFIDESSIAGGFMRMYVGIATGNADPDAGTVDPSGAEPFTNADAPGLYQGTLTLTATLD